jgi:hypothetical protein
MSHIATYSLAPLAGYVWQARMPFWSRKSAGISFDRLRDTGLLRDDLKVVCELELHTMKRSGACFLSCSL